MAFSVGWLFGRFVRSLARCFSGSGLFLFVLCGSVLLCIVRSCSPFVFLHVVLLRLVMFGLVCLLDGVIVCLHVLDCLFACLIVRLSNCLLVVCSHVCLLCVRVRVFVCLFVFCVFPCLFGCLFVCFLVCALVCLFVC